MDGLGTVVKIAASASSFYVVASPYEMIKTIHENKSTGKVSVIPFQSMLLSSSMWLLYSILLRNFFPLIITNVVFVSVVLVYLTVYYINSMTKAKLHAMFAAQGLFTLSVYMYAALSTSPMNDLIQTIGFIAITCSAIMVVSPLSTIVEVIETRSVAHLPKKLILATWISSVAWWLTGIIFQDAFIIYPNAVNAALGSLQLFLFVVFPSTSTAVAHLTGPTILDDSVGLLTSVEDIDQQLLATSDIK
ncbi:hypothetical protein Ae201684P_012168 [Aphanomyces euteiches]|nr:hypothetical protein Ae201684P_012168 [Aphanomyces euteiches]KAH9145138.1 hypothetical protein AeRB84_010953 [Aphanomyces euteiches]